MDLYLEGAQRGRDVRSLSRAMVGGLRLTWEASRRGVIVAATFQVLGALATAALVVVGRLALEAFVAPDDAPRADLVMVIVGLAVVTAVGAMAATMQVQQQRLLAEEVSVATWRRVLDVTGRVELEFYESARFYDQLERVRANALIRPVTVTTSVFGLLGGAVGTVGLLVVLLLIDPLLVPILLLAGVPSIFLARRASLLEFRHTALTTPIFRAREYLREVLTGRNEAKEVRAFGAESALRRRHDERSAGVLESLRGHVRARQRYAMGVVAITTVALAGSLAVLVWFLAMGRIGVADAGAAALGIRLLSSRLDQAFQSIGTLMESSVFLDDLDRFLGLAGPAGGVAQGAGPRLRAEITLDGVSYVYPGGTTPVLDGVNMSIKAGEVVAIVGESGSGKTTLAKIIAGLYPPTAGSVRWDGTDVAELAPADVRRSVSVIFQDFVRYQLTARENIGLGEPDAVDDLAAVHAAARAAGAAEFLESLPHGYGTILSRQYADGVDLSVGQWQRVALARALRRDAPLVILDEPSSALDPRAEQALFADVRTMLEGRTAVLISHRYSTVRTADRIYVMRDGRILEAGSHESLMADAGLYAELFTLQAQAYR
jgi:ATP-binding cassette, subfamily B, bacterial